MLVRALEACFIDGQRRRRDAEFDYEPKEGEGLPSHLVPVKSREVKPEAKPPEAIAISELTKGDKAASFVDTFAKKRK